MDNLSYIIGLNNAGGSGSTPSWGEIEGKPFNTVGTGLTVTAGALQTTGEASVDWSDVLNKPTFATVAVSGDYDDLINKPTIPAATSVTVTQTLSSGTAIADIDVDGVTTTLYAPAGGGGTAVTPNWNATSGQDGYIDNKPRIRAGDGVSGLNGILECGARHAFSNCHAEGHATMAPGVAQHAQGKYNDFGSANNFYADMVGNGVDEQNRSNAEATDWSGNKYLAGNIYLGVSNWTTPTLGAAKLPKEADFNYALDNSLVDGLYQVQEAQDLIDNQSYDEWNQPEYTGDIEKVFIFKYVENFALDGDDSNRVSGYIWVCESAAPAANPDYGNDPEGGGDEPEPEEEPEG